MKNKLPGIFAKQPLYSGLSFPMSVATSACEWVEVSGATERGGVNGDESVRVWLKRGWRSRFDSMDCRDDESNGLLEESAAEVWWKDVALAVSSVFSLMPRSSAMFSSKLDMKLWQVRTVDRVYLQVDCSCSCCG